METSNISTRTVTTSTSVTSMPRVWTSTTGTTTIAIPTSASRLPGSHNSIRIETPTLVIVGVSIYLSFVDFIHPPSILPISSIISCKQMYFLLSKDLVSFIRRMRKRRVFNLTLAFSRIGTLLELLEYPASRKSSTISIILSSLRLKIVNRSDFKTSFL